MTHSPKAGFSTALVAVALATAAQADPVVKMIPITCFDVNVWLKNAQAQPVANTEVHYAVNGVNSGWRKLVQTTPQPSHELCFSKNPAGADATIDVRARTESQTIAAKVKLKLTGDLQVIFQVSNN